MAKCFSRRMNGALVFALAIVVLISSATFSVAQDEPAKSKPDDQEKAASQEQSDQDKDNFDVGANEEKEPGKFRTVIEPGIIVYGKSNRFAAVGNTQSFDSSPDGRTLVFASSKIKFFDLNTNEVVGKAGKNNEHYSKVRYSPDGRQVFAATQSHGKSIVRVFDAIDMTSTGTIDSKIEDDESSNIYFHMQSLEVSADAKYVGFTSHDSIQVRSVADGELAYHAKEIGYVRKITFSPDEKYLIFSKNNQLVVIDLETGEEQDSEDWPMVGKYASACSINLSRNLMLCSFAGQSLSIYDLSDLKKEPSQVKLKSMSYVQSADFSDDGTKIALSTWRQDGTTPSMGVDIVDVDKKKVTDQFNVASQGEMNFRFSPDNKSVFVSGHGIFGVKEVPIAKDAGIEENNQPSGPAQMLAMHPSGEAFLACSQGGEVSWIDASTGEVDRSIQNYNINGLEFNEDGSEVLVCSQWSDSPVSRIRFADAKQVKAYSIKASMKKGTVFSAIRKFMVGQGPTANIEDRTHSQSYSLAGSYVHDQKEIAMIGAKQTYHLVKNEDDNNWTTSDQEITLKIIRYDVETGRRVYESSEISPGVFGMNNSNWVQHAGISPDGTQFVVGDTNHAYVIDAETGELIEKLAGEETHGIAKVSYSPDGKLLVITNQGGIDVYDTESFERVYDNFEKGNGAPIFAFSSDSKRMVVGSRKKNKEVSVLDTQSWKKVFSRSETVGKRVSTALSKDGQKVLIGLGDCRVEMWDLAKASSD